MGENDVGSCDVVVLYLRRILTQDEHRHASPKVAGLVNNVNHAFRRSEIRRLARYERWC
jgi:hypothetical protein